ncbi:MAG TPA: hypothetical protein VI076_04350 [Actinopolymorphaceae bacterium]
MGPLGWIILVLVIAGIFVLISGEAVVALILTAVWSGAIWLLVEHAATLMSAVWPAIVVVLALVVLSVITLAVLASAMEDRRFKDRGRPAPPS